MAVDAAVLDALLDDTTTGVLPAGYAGVDRVLTLLRAPALPTELAGEAHAVAAFTAERERATRPRVALPWAAAAGGRRPARVAVLVATALVALGGTAYAAGQGSLPGPFQHVVHDALHQVGIDVPTGGEAPPVGAIDAGTRSGRHGVPADAADGARPGTTSTGAPKSDTSSSGTVSSANGNSGADKGSSSTAPGQTGDTPGQSGVGPGQSASAPGQTGNTPGHAGTPPGQGATPTGQGGTPPGQRGVGPGQSESAPGQTGETPDGSSSDAAAG
jgi:hypothetical protein